MSKKNQTRDPNSLLNYNLRLLADLKKRFAGNTAEDMKVLLKRDIVEQEQKIERIKLNMKAE